MSVVGEATRGDLLDVALALGRSSLVVGSLGNVSVRHGDGLHITPSTLPYELMLEQDMVTLNGDGSPREGGLPPSRETPLHRAIYAARPDVGAIVHTHSPHAVAWSFLGVPLVPQLEELDYYGIGTIGVSRPAPVGSNALGEAAATALGDGGAVLLGRHGVVTVADDPRRAFTLAEVVEHYAEVAWLLRLDEGLLRPTWPG
ncbi:class II aldolase/adducin family protein [Conexibacter sp. JD483]|uniref:class II aldolase/adducin family protein n=1 Tax=unclassified Conexibacter TaxID=2627773 RepID=UPI00271D23AC|nr:MULTISPECIES: class II aldolase/adducin family protein [unclassified Conexibacter]MDO8185881.1 class II aldolase/adducin family protein [Conexibacter sp. CPCC 205706]MDO8198624.1 class II aldolase/adducin family protein [Conexibacter sp. CPCC 205762]MDR9367710.1 class II aldolase/adducin family protein [Conexibacter sp. JD483]